MTPWLIIRTDLAREARVAAAYVQAGFETFLPMDIRSRPVSQRGPRTTRRRIVTETPLIPCVLFVHATPESLPALKYVRRVACDEDGLPYRIPPRQMVAFMAYCQADYDEKRQMHGQGKPIKPPKPKFVELKGGLAEYARRKFGVDIDAETGEVSA